MKKIKTFVFTIILLCSNQIGKAQTLNWNALGDSKHIINASLEWDYSVSYNIGYAYKLNTTMPLVLNTDISLPAGENLIDDFKTKIGGQLVLLNKSEFKGSVTLNAIYRRYENPLVRLQNFGSEMKGTMGYYKMKWFVAAEFGFDKAVLTHFKHSDSFKENVLTGVQDGWYEPATGGNFLYGIQTGYSFNDFDLTFSIGKTTTEDFKTTPLIPYYVVLGFNYKIDR